MPAADIGMNLSGVSYYSSEAPFIDRFKMSGAWYAVKPDYSISTMPIAMDANGYPTSIPSDSQGLAVNINVDYLNTGQPNRYVLTYSGSADVGVFGGNVVSQTPGQIVFDFTRTDVDFVIMTVLNDDPNNPVNDVHLVRQDQMPLFQAGEIFSPAFLEKANNWSLIRYMDWEATNVLKPVTWDQRTTPTSSSWAYGVSGSGVPLEIMVALANKTHTDMWFNVPTQADDTYVRKALTYIRDNLDPSLKVKVEYSNEVWNWGFDASAYCYQKALEVFGDQSGGMWMQYYGYRSAQIASMAKTVFGATGADRLEDVLSTQTVYVGLEQNTVQGVARAGLGTVGQLFDDYAITTYFGWTMDVSSQNANDQATMLGWARSGEAGMAAAFHELEYGGALSEDSSLAVVKAIYARQEAFAQANGLNLVAYEGGAHLTANFFPAAVQNEILDFVGRLMNDPRMGQLYTKMVQDFADSGGTELTGFGDVGTNGIYGYWGILDNIYQNSSPRYDALIAAAAASSGIAKAAAIPATTASTIGTFQGASWASAGARQAVAPRSNSVVSKIAAFADMADGGDTVDDDAPAPAAIITSPSIAAAAAAAATPMVSTAAAAISLTNAIVSANLFSSASSAPIQTNTAMADTDSMPVATARRSASAFASTTLRAMKLRDYQDFAL